MAHGVNPRSRLIRFSKNSSFHYFTVDEMGLRLMKLVLDEMALYRFQRYLQQNGICKASMLPLYLFSLELLSEAYALKKGKQMRAELDRHGQQSVKKVCVEGIIDVFQLADCSAHFRGFFHIGDVPPIL